MKKLLFLFILMPYLGLGQTQIGQDIDGESAGDQSGFSVSLSSDGSIVAIGATGSDVNGFDSSYVRVYENQSGSWVQIGSDIDGESAGDMSGFSVSLSSDGSIVAIGAIGNNGNGSFSGHVRVYENQSGSWVQVGSDIDGESAGVQSGWSVSLSSDGSSIAIGNIGHVKVYENQSGSWVQIGSDIDGESAGDMSGFSVSLSSDGSIVAIGAIGNNGNGSFSGHVRIYQNQSDSWVQVGSDIDGEAVDDQSGYNVSLSSDGSIIAIGARLNDGGGIDSGHVRVYENQSGSWVQVGSDIDGEAAGDESGFNVSLSNDGSIVAIGANKNNGNGAFSGHVRIYKNQLGSWVQVGSDIDGESVSDRSGWSVSLSSDGSIVAIGAPVNSANGSFSGHVRVYNISSELALLEVVEDIQGNANGVNVTAIQLNTIEGVSGAIDGVNYTTALQNGTYADPYNPTAAEIQAVIDAVNDSLSLEENSLSVFKLYPNPAKNQFTIQFTTSLSLEKVTIYNTLGQEVLTSKNTIVDTSTLASGSYIVEITTNNGKASKNLIIE